MTGDRFQPPSTPRRFVGGGAGEGIERGASRGNDRSGYQVEDNPITPPNSPQGQLHVNDTGDVSLIFRFPAEVTSWSRVSARVEFSPQGSNVLGQTFEVHNVPISPRAQTRNVTLRSPVSRTRPNPIILQSPISRTRPDANMLSPISRTYPDLESLERTHGSSSSQRRPPSPLEYVSRTGNAVNSLDAARPPANVVDPFVDDDNEPVIVRPNFTLADLPDPVYPTTVRGSRLPWAPPRPQKYYVVIKGFKIGIFLQRWNDISDWVMVSGGLVRKADNWSQAKELWDGHEHERSILPLD